MTRKLALTFLGFFFICTVFGGNVIGNGDFELTTTPSASCWTTIGTQTYSIETLSPLSGLYSAKVVTGTAGTITSQGIYHMVCFPKASNYTVTFQAKASAPCAIQSMLIQSFNSFGTLVTSPAFNVTTSTQTFTYNISSVTMSGLCKFAIYYGNVPTGTTLWLDSVVVQESAPLSSVNLCNGDFETTMNNAMYTPTGYIYNFRSSGTSTKPENQYYYGWTKLKLATVTDTAAIVFDNSAAKISGAQSLKFTTISNGTVHAFKNTDHQLAWVFAGVRNSNYTISFKAKSTVNTNVGLMMSNWGTVNYIPEKTIALTPSVQTFAFSTSTVINQTDNRTIMSFLLGLLPTGQSVWIDDVNLVQGSPVSSISLSASAANINKNSTFQLTATVLPSDAAIKTIIWSSSDNTVATVNANGVVTSVATGVATITATTLEGGFTSSAVVTVSTLSDFKIFPPVTPSTSEVLNPDRGFFHWIWTETMNVPCTDYYNRVNWNSVESSLGVYDFSSISTMAEQARTDPDGKGKLGFGIRSVVETTDHAYPTYMDAQMNSWKSNLKTCWVPDWNSPYFLERHDSLIAALGRQFNNDPRIAYVEIRSYGDWGEWHLNGFENPVLPVIPIKDSTIYRLIDAYIKAFPNKQLIMMSDNPIGLGYALSKTGLKYPIGWRRDSWCNIQFRNLSTTTAIFANRWKTAPVIIESYGGTGVTPKLGVQQIIDYHVSAVGNGNIGDTLTLSTGAKDSIRQSARIAGFRNVLRSVSYPTTIIPGQSIRINAEWSNIGVAPTYNNWIVNYRLCNRSTGVPVWSRASKYDLRKLLPTFDFSTAVDVSVFSCDTLDIPTTLVYGNYDLEVLVTDSAQYYNPMKLGNVGQKANGAYGLGSVVVSGLTDVNKLQSTDDFSILKVAKTQVQLDIQQFGIYGLSVFSVDGRSLFAKNNLNLEPGIHAVDINTLSKGIYIVKITNSNRQKVVRFVVNQEE
jgi:uncharacterized protein YjdB